MSKYIRAKDGTLFPAHAGVILYKPVCCPEGCPFPRTRGGDPIAGCGHSLFGVLFPAHAGVILLCLPVET